MDTRKILRLSGSAAGLALAVCLVLPSARADTPALAHAPVPMPDAARFALVVEQGDLDGVAAWLADGLNPDFVADRIGSGLMIAAWEGNIAMMELFVGHGAKIDLTNRYDEQALQLAAWRGHVEAVRWLLDHGASPNRPGARWSALHYATFANRQDVARLLIERGAEVNARAPNGSTVLMMAAREGHDELARQILDAGADPRAVNERGESALTWAMRHEHFTLARLVSDQAEFAQAAKADPASFGAPVRSVAAPPEIEEILRRIRLAEAAGQPTDALRKTLLAMVEHFKQESKRIVIDAPAGRKAAPRGKPGALMITARRAPAAGGGQRAELVYPAGAAQTPPASASVEPSAPAAAPADEISAILAQMQRAQAAGQPVDRLRQALYDAVARRKGQP